MRPLKQVTISIINKWDPSNMQKHCFNFSFSVIYLIINQILLDFLCNECCNLTRWSVIYCKMRIFGGYL